MPQDQKQTPHSSFRDVPAQTQHLPHEATVAPQVEAKIDRILALLGDKASAFADAAAQENLRLKKLLLMARAKLDAIEQLPNTDHEQRGPLAREAIAAIDAFFPPAAQKQAAVDTVEVAPSQ